MYFFHYHPLAVLIDYKKDDTTRKPNLGMVLQVQIDFSLKLKESTLVGDKSIDIVAGISDSVGYNLLFTHDAP